MRACLLLFFSLVSVVPAFAGETDVTRLSVELRMRRAHMSKAPEHAFSVQLAGELTDAVQQRLEAQGVSFDLLSGKVAHVGAFYGVRATEEGLAALSHDPYVRTVLSAAPPMALPSLDSEDFDYVPLLTTGRQARALRDANGHHLTGAGMIICDIDAGTDVFHPLFFKPDGGYYAWLDRDGDERFALGVDAVDLDSDDAADEDEILRKTGGGLYDSHTGKTARVDEFIAGLHWLYADTNNNGVRDYGPSGGYSDSDPGFGEPVFVVDDVDSDGTLDVGERLILLSTSKILGLIRVQSGEEYVRGENLTEAPTIEDTHGSAVAGILIGGVIGHTWLMGVAPEAELVVIDTSVAEDDPREMVMSLPTAVARARQYDPRVFVHEYGSLTYTFNDGADPWETFIDEMTAAGEVQVTATHNFAGSGGKAIVTLAAHETRDMDVTVISYPDVYTPYYFMLTALHRGASGALQATLALPNGTLLVDHNFTQGHALEVATDSSARGTDMIAMAIYGVSGGGYADVDTGTYTLTLTNSSDAPLEVHLASSDQTGYSILVHFESDVTDASTMAWPSTADTAISVGASVGHTLEESELDLGLKIYSGRGPRIDGELAIEIVAPCDHYGAMTTFDPSDFGDFRTFGGTSGALPQVAGAITLLLQAESTLTPAQVMARVEERARGDALTGSVPNPEWGYGRLSTYRLITGTDPDENVAPVARLSAPSAAAPNSSVTLDASASTDPDGDVAGLTYRFDLDYDGTWDVSGVGTPVATTSFASSGRYFVKLEVEDVFGMSSSALVGIDIASRSIAPTTSEVGCACRAQGPGLALLLAGALLLRSVRRRPLVTAAHAQE